MTAFARGWGALRPGQWVAITIAFLWSGALLVAAAVLPIYQSMTATSSGFATSSGTVISSGTVTHRSATLIHENGFAVLLIVGVPLLITLAVATALCRRGARRGAGPVAWTLTGLLTGFILVAMLSIGPFIIPVTACLAIACSIHKASPLPEARPTFLPA